MPHLVAQCYQSVSRTDKDSKPLDQTLLVQFNQVNPFHGRIAHTGALFQRPGIIYFEFPTKTKIAIGLDDSAQNNKGRVPTVIRLLKERRTENNVFGQQVSQKIKPLIKYCLMPQFQC